MGASTSEVFYILSRRVSYRSLAAHANALCLGLRDSLSRSVLEDWVDALLPCVFQALLHRLLVLRYIPDDESVPSNTGKGARMETGYSLRRSVSGFGSHINRRLLSWLPFTMVHRGEFICPSRPV